PFAASMLLWISICTISWWLSDSLARSMARFAPGVIPPLVCLTAGYLVNLLLSSMYNPAVLWWMVEVGIVKRSSNIDFYFAVERNLLSGDYLRLLLVGGTPGLFVWLAGNYLFEVVTGIPRIRSASLAVVSPVLAAPATPAVTAVTAGPAVPAPTRAAPRFFQRLTRITPLEPDDLLAVAAEDHYIQVHTSRGKELIYYRFGDALDELAALDGLAVDPRRAVDSQAIERIQGEGRNMHVVLNNGESFRVSLSNRGAVLNARNASRS
ncbi:MAG: LytTR family transcriptional regulator, partial [Gammaproteobacteria bacterium]|nr:LytTR family transcriptional regulator [Gammaproteobacteria bacterium]